MQIRFKDGERIKQAANKAGLNPTGMMNQFFQKYFPIYEREWLNQDSTEPSKLPESVDPRPVLINSNLPPFEL